MAETKSHRFRTAMGGFHKGDVCAYITKISGEHRAETEALTQELENLRQENEALRAKAAAAEAELLSLREGDPETAEPAPVPPPENITEMELEAYRRAEAAERLAHQRAKRLYADMQDIYTKAEAQLHTVSGAAGTAMDAIEEAMHTMKTALEDTKTAARSAQKSLEEMGALVPDPAEGLEADA